MSTIQLKQLSKHFGDLIAVNKLDLDIAAGEVLCLLGPSGCGKTTTLRMVAGLETATEGDILLGGQRVNELKARQRNVAMAFQFYALYPSLSVAENLAYPLHAEKLPRAEIKQRVQKTAKTLELDGILDRLPNQLAEGEKQRVAVGRAIIRDPQCFLFDEPLSRLDVELRQTMRGQIKEVLSGLSKATVIVTHDQLEALTMADRIAVMRDGLLEQVASPHEIFTRPRSLFVAGFIGTPQMNLLDVTVLEQRGGKIGFQMGGQQVWHAMPHAVAVGAKMTLGIRPRAFELASEEGRDTLSAVTDIIEPMGAETLVHLLDGEHDLRVVLRRGQAPEVGERVHVRCKPEQVLLFDSDGRLLKSGAH